jgi:flagellar biosynthesis/type III secretory pathway M-ring protein FliF/YscJ
MGTIIVVGFIILVIIILPLVVYMRRNKTKDIDPATKELSGRQKKDGYYE